MQGIVFPWFISKNPPDIIQTAGNSFAAWVKTGTPAFIVFPAERRAAGPLTPARLDQQIQSARQMQPPDCIIAGIRIIAIGDAWRIPSLVSRLRALLIAIGFDHLTVLPREDPWHVRLVKRLLGVPHFAPIAAKRAVLVTALAIISPLAVLLAVLIR